MATPMTPYIEKECDKLRCRICPIRFFYKKFQMRRQISSARNVDGGIGTSSPLVFQLARALRYRGRGQVISAFDMVTGLPPSGGRYLEKASGQIATWKTRAQHQATGYLAGMSLM